MKSLLFISLLLVAGVCKAGDPRFSVGIQLNTSEELDFYEFQYPINYSYSTMSIEDIQHVSISLQGKYFLKNNTALRLLLGMTQSNYNTDHVAPTTGNDYYHYLIDQDQLDWNFAFGIEKKFVLDKFGFTAGVQIPLNLYGESELFYSYDHVVSGDVTDTYDSERYQEMGYSVGIGGLVGIQYSVLSRVSIYSEFSFSWMVAAYGGEGRGEGYINGAPITNRPTTWNQVYKRSGILLPVGSFGIAYHF